MKSRQNLWAAFSRWVITGWMLVLFLRALETFDLNRHHFVFHLIENECIGICIDIVLISAFLALLFPVFYLLFRSSIRAANIFVGSVLALLSLCHIAIIQFFIQTSTPLGGMLISHTINEVFFTVRTSGTHYFFFGIMLLTTVALIVGAWYLLKKCRFRTSVNYAVAIFSAIAIMISVLINNSLNKVEQEAAPYSLRINKSYYFYRNICSVLLHPYTATNHSIEFSKQNALFPTKHFVSEEYPLLSETNFQDVLGSFFNATTDGKLPNIVVIIVEGLGSRFLPDFHGLKLMPFLDSLSTQSLHWDKALTVGERSYSVVPSLLASAPYGKSGFTFENENLLSLSLVNMLSLYNYYSVFFYGQPKWFHNKGPYFYRNGLNKLVDCAQFPGKYSRIMVDDYFWGHHDQDLVSYALEYINDSLPEAPRLDIYFTGTTHAPFIIDNEEHYNQCLNHLIQQTGLDKQQQKFVLTYKKYVRTLLFADDALRWLFEGYQQHPSFQNTIFIITGDHPMTEIPIENSYQRYRVPIIIYSPLLNQAKQFHSVNTHLDIAPTLLAFLHHNYRMEIPQQNAFIGKTLDTATCFRNLQPVAFMNGSRLIADLLYENYFLLNEKTLFKVDENDQIARIEDKALQEKMFMMLQNFKRLNSYCCSQNKLIPDTLYYNYTGNVMLYQFENRSFNVIKNQEFGYTVVEDFLFSGAGQYYFDFCIHGEKVLPKEVSTLVIELMDKETGEQISWNGFNLTEKQGFLHFSFDISTNKEMVLRSYFWNNHQTEFYVPNTSGRFYRLKKQHDK
jgi:uncharacterized sulfatase